MSTLLIPIIDYGAIGIDSDVSFGRREHLVDEFAAGGFDRSTPTKGLLTVLEYDPSTKEASDVSAEIAKQAAVYIDANELNASGNVLRFLQDHGAVPEWVSSIEEGRYLAADLAHAA